jgi:mannose/cellobiose epimerase-like protein (N-acyl-D-glucosamine 2-epimerase family)
LAYEITNDEKFVEIGVEAAGTVLRYLETDIPGLWRDERSAEGSFVVGPSPASSFYHLVDPLLNCHDTKCYVIAPKGYL